MRGRVVLAGALAGALAGCAGLKRVGSAIGSAIGQALESGSSVVATRAERTLYRETSTYADVVAFLDTLQASGAPVALGSIGRSTEGREIPYVIASRPLVHTPAEARRLGRPVVYVQGNIHAGEVEGKEALLALVRDLVEQRAPNVLDSIVLVAVPIYNTDGNERFASQAQNRNEQNGPELVGQRANGQGLDLNRDYVKAEAPETRASLAAFAAWDPDLFVDLHTTDGSFHGYALTYAPPLAPVGEAAPFVRDSLLPVLRERMRTRDGFETFDYGNFDRDERMFGGPVAGRAAGDTTIRAWETYDHRPRYGTNYVGLRGRAAILSEAFSHDPFERRVKATYAFVREILSLVAERRASFGRLARADAAGPAAGTPLAIRARLTTTPFRATVPAEELERTSDSTQLTEPGVPRGLRRTGRYRSLDLTILDRFEPQRSVAVPVAYAIPGASEDLIRLLRLHGLVVERTTVATYASAAAFTIDSIARARRAFQGHYETTVTGRWLDARTRSLAAGTVVVPTAQALGALAVYLLEPESDDGLVTWNTLDDALARGAEFPVLRLDAMPAAPRRAAP
ncbi:MAG TPA: M14 family metallopeptidase [Gemmatimonadaceae bacterium]|nr:M14 family metallopeptidase [Gemmatimonadaceae bacterium]